MPTYIVFSLRFVTDNMRRYNIKMIQNLLKGILCMGQYLLLERSHESHIYNYKYESMSIKVWYTHTIWFIDTYGWTPNRRIDAIMFVNWFRSNVVHMEEK